jgi:hypothetical protein
MALTTGLAGAVSRFAGVVNRNIAGYHRHGRNCSGTACRMLHLW